MLITSYIRFVHVLRLPVLCQHHLQNQVIHEEDDFANREHYRIDDVHFIFIMKRENEEGTRQSRYGEDVLVRIDSRNNVEQKQHPFSHLCHKTGESQQTHSKTLSLTASTATIKQTPSLHSSTAQMSISSLLWERHKNDALASLYPSLLPSVV